MTFRALVMQINLASKYFYKYFISGFLVTSYSLIILSSFEGINFIIKLTFVEISSHFIRWLFFEKFVYSDVKFISKQQSLITYIYSITLPYLLNVIFYVFFPFKKVFLNSFRVIFISAVVGFFWSKFIYKRRKLK